MAISDSQKVDLLYKKIAWAVAKTDTNPPKEAYNETNPSPLLIRGDVLWQLSGSIPASIPTATSSIVQVYKDGGGSYSATVECTELAVTDNRTWSTGLTDWISQEFGSTYFVKVYIDTTGSTTPQTTGTALQAAGVSDDQWFFDYQAGILNFIGTNLPTAIATGVTGKSIFISGARYVGPKGVTSWSNGLTIGNVVINGNTITGNTGVTFGGNITTANIIVTNNLFWANGISALAPTYGNTQVAQYLPVYGGNISASNVTITVTSTGTLAVSSTANISGNVGIAANLSVTGNIYGNIAPGSNITASQYQLYVAKNGSDSNNGTINAPFLTIKAAMAAAGAITSATGVSVNVAPGSYTEVNPVTIPAKVALMGDNLRNVTVIPQTPNADLFYMTNGCYVWGITIRDYTANGFSYSSSTSSQNVFVSPYIQNLTSTTTTGTAVMIDGNFVSNISTKAMIVGFFTIINRGGYGIHLTNSAYSQLVNIYTIATEIGVLAESGAFCTLNGSDCSIGNVGLKADGVGPLLTYGNSYGYSTGGVFQIRDMPASPHVNQTLTINGDSNFYSIDTITQLDALTWQVTVQETYASNLAPMSNIRFYQRSAVVASAHTFEYVGAGTDPATALPQYGGIPNADLEVIQINGGRVTYTATDHKGNFKIGANLTINQGTGTISGDSFNRSLFALMTPYILALDNA
jgi:hypothetical protein